MKPLFKALAVAFIVACSHAAVPLTWTVDASRIQPTTLEAYHGETLQLAATLTRNGSPVSVGANTASFLWQTNGMGSAWWRTNAVCSATGVVSASFTPAMDPGANQVSFFFSVVDGSGTSYRASGRIVLRPSPGANPTVAALPAPGGTLDFSSVQVENAPWATLSAVDSAIAAAVEPLCSVAAANALVQNASNALAQAMSGISVPSLSGYAAESWVRQYVSTNMPAAVNLSGYATEAWVQSYHAANPPSVDLSGYATKTYAEAVASNAVAGVQMPSLAGYATQTWTREYVTTNLPSVDLSPYATKTYADSAAATAAAGVQVPSLAGYATQTWTREYVTTNLPSIDLGPYATKAYADSAAATAAAGVQVPSLAGYATQTWTREYVTTNLPSIDLGPYATKTFAAAVASNAVAGIQVPSLSGYATETYVNGAVGNVAASIGNMGERISNLQRLYADAGQPTRLWAPDGSSVMDGTGCVWQVTYMAVTNWVSASNGVEFVYRGVVTEYPNGEGIPDGATVYAWDPDGTYAGLNGVNGSAVLYLWDQVIDGVKDLQMWIDLNNVAGGISASYVELGSRESFTNRVEIMRQNGVVGGSAQYVNYDILTAKPTTKPIYTLKTRVAYTNDVLSSGGGGSADMSGYVQKSGVDTLYVTNLTTKGMTFYNPDDASQMAMLNYGGHDSSGVTWNLGIPGGWESYVLRYPPGDDAATVAFLSDIDAATNGCIRSNNGVATNLYVHSMAKYEDSEYSEWRLWFQNDSSYRSYLAFPDSAFSYGLVLPANSTPGEPFFDWYERRVLATRPWVNNVVDQIPTTYGATNQLAAANCTVQTVVDPAGDTLPQFQVPDAVPGGIRDWVVHVVSSGSTDITLTGFPATVDSGKTANFFSPLDSVTNKCTHGTITTFYFSEINSTANAVNFMVNRAELKKISPAN